MAALLLETVTFLAQRAEQEEPGRPTRDRLEEVTGACTRLKSEDIADYFCREPESGNTWQAGESGFVFLPSVAEPPLIPILHMTYNLAKPEAKLQTGVFVVKGVAKDNITAFGYRFEPPHGEGAHNYWHAQPATTIRYLYNKSFELPRAPKASWAAPDNMPTLPLDAEEPIDLLICMMLSLYGLKHTAALQADFGGVLYERLQRMRCCPHTHSS